MCHSLYETGLKTLVSGEPQSVKDALLDGIILKALLLSFVGAGALGVYVAKETNKVTGALAGISALGLGIGTTNLLLNAKGKTS